ncbi:TRAP transporter large permease subunit [Chloroflexota bacterium]
MEWYLALIIIFGTLLILMLSGMEIAFCFLFVTFMGALLWWGGGIGLVQLSLSLSNSVAKFSMLPLPLFILMGEVLMHSGLGPDMIDALDKWLGRLPGRLGLLAVGAGTLFSTLTGASIASVALLGSTLVPEMEKRGYKKSMSLGPILGSGGLAIMVPPSGLAVLFGALAEVSIGRILMAIIIPGLLMAILYATYIVIRCRLQPSIAPAYDVPATSMSSKFVATARYILPTGLVVFLVIGVIYLGIATPSEAAATGVIGCLILAAINGKLNWVVLKKSFFGTVRVSVMMLLIVTAATAFSQILAFSGASRGLIALATSFAVSPIFILFGMIVVLTILGMFMNITSVMMVSIPIFMPIIPALGFDPVWFAVIFLLSMEMAATTPPVGLALFVMKGVAPAGTTMGEIYRAGIPFLGCDIAAMAILIAFPIVALWLPNIAFS